MIDCVGLITARGGSVGIPGKNLKLLGGKPLIAWTIEAARASRGLRRVIMSTDDQVIADVAKQYGAEVPFLRPAELARENSTHVSVAEHALDWLDKHENDRPGYLMLLQPTSPLRTAGDIDNAVEIAETRNADFVVSITEATTHPILTRTIGQDGMLWDFIPSHGLDDLRRQNLPPAYVLNGAIYLVRREVFLTQRTFHPPRAYPCIMPQERSVDIDTAWDLKVAELVIQQQNETRQE
jgi:CMP-N,N'-diacetyllegionaminic acid synthase